MRLSDVDTGLRADQVLTIPVSLLDPSRLSFAEDTANKSRYRAMQSALSALAGVRSVALGSTMPLRRSGLDFAVRVEGQALTASDAVPMAEFRTASPEYFRTAGIPMRKGREFSNGDSAGTTRVAIVNESFAAEHFPGREPIGHRLAFVGDVMRFTPVSGDWRTIVGVVADTRDGGPDAAPRAVIFAPFDQEFAMLGGLVVRSEGDASALTAAATRIVRSIAPSASLDGVMTVTQIREQSVRPRRLNAVLASSFGMLAVLIAAVGIAGVLAFSVSARTIEIGIMMSLGADSGRVQRMILREGGSLLLIGIALGVAGTLVTGGAIRGLLFGISPRDPATFVAVVLLVAGIGLVACWIPARRASRIDPAIAMRS
jgi:putative ABC transport system permease protein